VSQLTLDARHARAARLVPPPSKSDALRLLAVAHILDRPDWLTAIGPRPWASDVETFASGLAALRSAEHGEAILIDCHDGGAPLRFLLSLAAITPGRFRFVGSARLGARPHAPLVTALSRALGPGGLSIRSGDPWPIEVHASGATGEPLFRVSGAESSQYPSSLVVAAAALFHREHRPWLVGIDGPVVSEGYLELTLRALRQAGFRVERLRSSVEILAWDAHAAQAPGVPADWSAIAFLLPIAWKTGGSVAGLPDADLGDVLEDVHPDRAIIDHLHHAGLEVSRESGDARVRGELHRGLRASAARAPDLIPVLAALACLLPDTSVFTEISRLRSKESDRLEAIQDLVAASGATSHLEGDSLHIEPALHAGGATPLRFDARDDHRMIMAAATLAVLLGTTLELRRATGVEKSFPGFFGQLALAGIELC